MAVGPNFSHSGVQESLLTQVPKKPRLITILPLGEQMWQRCMSVRAQCSFCYKSILHFAEQLTGSS
jgi:hypothetical protein